MEYGNKIIKSDLSAVSGDAGIINKLGSIDTQATAGERFPDETLVSTVIPVRIGLDPRVTGGGD